MQSSFGLLFSYIDAGRAPGLTAALAAFGAATGAFEGRAKYDRQEFELFRLHLRPVSPYLTPGSDPCNFPCCTARATIWRDSHSTGEATLTNIKRRRSQVISQSNCVSPIHDVAYHSCRARLNKYQCSLAHSSTPRILEANSYCESNTSCCISYSRFPRVDCRYRRKYVTCEESRAGAAWLVSNGLSATKSPANSLPGFSRGSEARRVSSFIKRVCNEAKLTDRPVGRTDNFLSHSSGQADTCIRGLRRTRGSLLWPCREGVACCNKEASPLSTAGQAATECRYRGRAQPHCSPEISATAPDEVADPALHHDAPSYGVVHSSLSSIAPPVTGTGLLCSQSGLWFSSKLKENIFSPTGRSQLETFATKGVRGSYHASAAAERRNVQSTRENPASCAYVRAAPVNDGAAGSAANDIETLTRSPTEDGEVDLAAEVARAIEGLRNLQGQRLGQLQVQQLETQQQKVFLNEKHQPPEASSSSCRPWRQPDLTDEDFDCLNKRWLALLTRLRPYGHISTGNTVKLFDNGDKAFTSMLQEIDQAQNIVLLETYMFDASLPARRVKDALCTAAQRGCFVVLIIDWVGSFNMPYAWKEELLNAGVHLVIFNPRFVLPVFSRNKLWPQDLVLWIQKNVISPAARFLGSLSSPRLASALFPLLGEPHLITDLEGNSNGSSGADRSASGRWRQRPAGICAGSRSAAEKISSHRTPEGKGSADSANSISSCSETRKEEMARTKKKSGDTRLEAKPGIAAEHTKEGNEADEISTPTLKVETHSLETEEFAKPKIANLERGRGPSTHCIPSGSAAFGEVWTSHGRPGESTVEILAESEVPEPLLWTNKVGPVPFRDHRKILIVDGKSAFTGSLNISEDGVGKQYGGRGFFYDLHARLRGPAVEHLQQLVFETLETCGASDLERQLRCHLTAAAERQRQAVSTQKMRLCDKQQASIQQGEHQKWPCLLAGHWTSHLLAENSTRAVVTHSHHHFNSPGEGAEACVEANDNDAEDVLIQSQEERLRAAISTRRRTRVTSTPLFEDTVSLENLGNPTCLGHASEPCVFTSSDCVKCALFITRNGRTVLKSNVLHNERSIQLALQAAISNASKSVCVTSSYFIPPGFLRRALRAALARGGVDVSLLLSGNSDVWGDVYATIYVVRKFLTKNSRRHSLFSAGWERSPLREKTNFSDMAAEFSSRHIRRPTASAAPRGAAASDPEEPESLGIAAAGPPHESELRKFTSVLLPHKFPMKADTEVEEHPIGDRFERNANPDGAELSPGFDRDTVAHSKEALITPRTILVADQAATKAERAAGGAPESGGTAGRVSIRDAEDLNTLLGEEREASNETFRGRAGVYFLSQHHCHAKNIVVDHIWSSLGSFNFDRFSSRRNLEVLVTFFDPQIAYKLESFHWKRIIEEAEEMTVEKWNCQPFIKKLLCSCCYYLTRFAGKNFFDGLSDQRSRAVLKRLLIASYLDDMPGADLFSGMAWGAH